MVPGKQAGKLPAATQNAVKCHSVHAQLSGGGADTREPNPFFLLAFSCCGVQHVRTITQENLHRQHFLKEFLQFPERLRRLMDEREVNNAQLARAIGLSHVAVGNFLDGQLPKSEHLYRLAKFFDVPMEYFLEAEPEARGRPLEIIQEMPVSQLSGPELERIALSKMSFQELVEMEKTMDLFARPKAGVSSNAESPMDRVKRIAKREAAKLRPSPEPTPRATAPSVQSAPPSHGVVPQSRLTPSRPAPGPKK